MDAVMGQGAEVRVFRYIVVPQAGTAQGLRAFVRVDEFTTTLILAGVPNNQPSAVTAARTLNMFLTPSSRGRGVTPSARSVIVRFTGERPDGLVSVRKSVVVLGSGAFNSYQPGQTGTFRGFPVVLEQKLDGVPSVTGA